MRWEDIPPFPDMLLIREMTKGQRKKLKLKRQAFIDAVREWEKKRKQGQELQAGNQSSELGRSQEKEGVEVDGQQCITLQGHPQEEIIDYSWGKEEEQEKEESKVEQTSEPEQKEVESVGLNDVIVEREEESVDEDDGKRLTSSPPATDKATSKSPKRLVDETDFQPSQVRPKKLKAWHLHLLSQKKKNAENNASS